MKQRGKFMRMAMLLPALLAVFALTVPSCANAAEADNSSDAANVVGTGDSGNMTNTATAPASSAQSRNGNQSARGGSSAEVGTGSGKGQNSLQSGNSQSNLSDSHDEAGAHNANKSGSKLSGSGSGKKASGLPSAQVNEVSAQGACNQTLDGAGNVTDRNWTLNGSTLVWNIHGETGTGECVLDLKSGTVPNYGYMPDPISPYALTPWYADQSVTKLVVSGPVGGLHCWRLFYGLSNLRYADVGNLDVSIDADENGLGGMFHMDTRLTTIVGLDRWDMRQIKMVDWIFAECGSLSSIDVSKWKLDSVLSLYSAFRNCNSLTILDLSKWYTPKVTSMRSMFYGCNSLRALDMSGLDTTSNSVDVHEMFNGPKSLKFFRLGPKTDRIDFQGLGAQEVVWYAEDISWLGKISDYYHPPTGLKWYGQFSASTSISFDANGASGTGPGPIAGLFMLPQQALPSASGFSRPGYRTVGWSSQKDSTQPEYSFGQYVFLPLDAVDTVLYAVWIPLPKAGLSNAVTPTQPTGEAGKVKLDGTVEQGAGIAGLQSGDKGEISLMHAGKESSSVLGDGTVANDADTSLDTGSYKWTSSFPVSDLAAMDLKGLGIPYTFRMRVNTTADGNSEYAFASRTLDVVAPVVTNAQVSVGSSGSGGSLHLTTRSSGNAAQAVVDTGATVTINWYDRSGAALPSVPSSGPLNVDSNGDLSIDVPGGVPNGSQARITVKDAAGNSSQGVNASGALIRLQFPTISLPLTGADWRSQLASYFPLALAAIAAALVMADLCRLRRAITVWR